MIAFDSITLGIIGLGYVGLPLAVEFAKHYPTIGFDINGARVAALRRGEDATREVTREALRDSRIEWTEHAEDLAACNVFIVTVPTPVDAHKTPDLRPLIAASETVGKVLSPGNVVVYESTVYPGATEEVCVPILQKCSGLHYNRDFFVGYSPERINPGDPQHRLPDIKKVTSGSTPETAQFIDQLYRTIISAGTHLASSIRVAEAAKVIENTQRDVNIALINELAMIFNRLGIDTDEVLQAAGTKWNFLPFRPGLVGGHCIGVDPYYLTYKAQAIGHHPEVILSGRRVNDGMGGYVANQLVKLMAQRGIPITEARVLVLGLTFKENCPDLRNTRVVDVIDELSRFNMAVDVYDPWIDANEAEREYGLHVLAAPRENYYDGMILAVAHRQFIALGTEAIRRFGKTSGHVLYDVKSVLPPTAVDGRL